MEFRGTEVSHLNTPQAGDVNIRASNINNWEQNHDLLFVERFLYNDKEVGIRHQKNRSRLKIYDGGNIELFSGDEAGIIINSDYNTTNLYGEAVNINTQLLRINTRSNGLMWNDHWLNPVLYQLSDKKNPRIYGRDWPPRACSPIDDLQLMADARYWCKGSPSWCCGAEEPHAGHWVRFNMKVTPFFRAWDDIEYRQELEKLGIPT